MRSAVLALLLAGCATVGPDYQRPEISLPAQYPASEAPGAEIAPDWWRQRG